jgi:type I restriction-modification system DNA methylase subunit
MMSQATHLGQYRNSNLFSNHYLDERVFGLDEWDCDEEAERAFKRLQDLYDAEQGTLASYDEDPLRRHWIDKVLEILGYEPLSETPILDANGSIDRTLYDTAEDRRAGAMMKADGEHAGVYDRSLSVLEAKQWNADFTQRFSETRSYRDASHQIKHYLEHTPESVSWGILTNGKKWRLYGTKDYETETYYEVDLEELLESDSVEVFKRFYVFFRPAAFRESAGTTFLDTVWSESETAAQELGEDLQDNVFTALRVLGEGFVEKNDLDIDSNDDERLADLKEHSLVLLYRLMFVLYAESRGLIDPDDPRAAKEYERDFSLDALRHEVIDEVGERADEADFEREFSSYSTQRWGRLEDLFALVDSGNDELGIPAYNGGLFDEESHEFLAECEVADRHLAEVIYRLSTTETDDGFVPADYADLDTRHLGTIYEGLLEHEFAIAPEARAAVAENGGEVWKPAEEVSESEAVETVEAGELYVVNDDGERKATGAYYTPDYVVTYIVEETVGPLLEEAEDELGELEPGTEEYVVAFWERVTDLKILDPAMGSGHFLTKATGYLADAVMERVRELESGSLFDEELVRRTISRECIYGVDVNGMAVELAKLSMWLETLAADQPLAFLDHHLKSGNSLVGSDITDVLADEDESGQMTLADFARTRRRALGQVMDRMGELLAIDNETLEDVHSMEEIYKRIREDPLYEHLQAMATVHTAGEFGLDVPEDAIERMARAIEDEGEWADIEATDWFRAARAMADEEGFFHWELEFPAVFFDGDGERLASAGFDAVVGNPPWVNIGRMPDSQTNTGYYKSEYETAEYQIDLYTLFLEQSVQLVGDGDMVGMIVPNPWLANYRTPRIRQRLLVENQPLKLVQTPRSAFSGVGAEHVITIIERSKAKGEFLRGKMADGGTVEIVDRYPVNLLNEDDEFVVYSNSSVSSAIERIEENSVKFGDVYETVRGVGPYHHNHQDKEIIERRAYHADHQEDDTFVPELKGSNLSRYNIHWDGDTWISYGDWLAEPREERFFEGKRLLLREILGERFEVAVIDEKYIVDRGIYIGLQNDSQIDLYYALALLASPIPVFWFREKFNEDDELFPKLRVAHFEMLPIRSVDFNSESDQTQEETESFIEEYQERVKQGSELGELGGRVSGYIESNGVDTAIHDFLSELAKQNTEYHEDRNSANLNLLDYLGTYEDGPTLGEVYQPASGLAASVLTDTAADSEFETLRVTGAQVERDGDRLRVLAEPYVKPTDPEAYDTNSRGYATLEPVPAMEFVGLDDAQAALIAAFVPHAVDEADGFAGYRDNATATISPLDRLEGLTLPKLADVEGGIERYMDARERAAELDEKIERTDELIDEIVYELYGLTDEEIAIVEEAVGD